MGQIKDIKIHWMGKIKGNCNPLDGTDKIYYNRLDGTDQRYYNPLDGTDQRQL